MIKRIKEKTWVTKQGRSSICKVAIRICDNCSIKEECRYITLTSNRRKRKSDKDYCYRCAQKLRIMPTGEKCFKWKHGKTYNGYSRISINKKRILEHVYVMQEFLGRAIEGGETIHHIDMDKSNNAISNLYLFNSQKDHQKCHILMEKIGFNVLNKKIWFDWNKKEYVLNTTEVPIFKELEIKEVGKRHISISCGKEYEFYNEKNKNGQWRHKRYHILIAEAILGRSLFRNECVHHVNNNSLDNTQSNLCVMTSVEHGACHCSLQKAVAELYRKGFVKFEQGNYFLG